MAVSLTGMLTFVETVVNLKTFPLFCGYLLMIALSSVWQKYTKPQNLRNVMILHNFTCCIASVYSMLGLTYNLCKSESIFQKGASNGFKPYYHVYWLTKIFELLDTAFMVLRHKRRQISVLHVYHHCSMLLLSDIAYHVYPWPCIAFYIAVNSLVHVVLYFYYGLTALLPDKVFAWKRHITQLQLLQFFVGLIHATVGYLFHGFCFYGILYGITMTVLFSNFYYRAYMKEKPSSENGKKSLSNGIKPHIN